jgi:hypothetical protein
MQEMSVLLSDISTTPDEHPQMHEGPGRVKDTYSLFPSAAPRILLAEEASYNQ